MIKHQTVEQILLVLHLFSQNYAGGTPLHKAYQEAVHEVADRHGVTYQTIGGACRRRLKLNSIRETYALLERWMDGDPEPLAKKLREASDPSAYDDISQFFGSFSATAAKNRQAPGMAAERKDDVFSVRLSMKEARNVRALAEMAGISPPEFLGQIVGSAVEEKMKRMARAILRESEADRGAPRSRGEILKILRDHEGELRDLGAEHVSIFGSVARQETESAADVDLAVRLKPGFSRGGIDYFGRFEALRARLAQILGCSVDLVEEPAEKARLQREIDADRVHAF